MDGACLTVTGYDGRVFTVDVSAETLSRTILGRYRVGELVNLELALRLSDRLGGHLVTGHIDGLATIKSSERIGESLKLEFSIGGDLSIFIIEKGSIALNGISLTVNECGDTFFSVNIIPHTVQKTTVSSWQIGDQVNVEVDIIGKYVAKFLGKIGVSEKKQSKLDRDFLARHGFL